MKLNILNEDGPYDDLPEEDDEFEEDDYDEDGNPIDILARIEDEKREERAREEGWRPYGDRRRF